MGPARWPLAVLPRGALFALMLLGAASAAWTQEDTTPPSLFSAHAADYDGELGIFRFYIDEKLDRNSVPAPDAFQVQIEGVDWMLSGVAIACFGAFRDNCGRSVELTLSPIPFGGRAPRLTRVVYTPPSENPLQDLAGNRMAAFDTMWASAYSPPPPPAPPPPPPPEPEPPASDCTLVAPYWSGPTGGFTVRPAPGRTSVSLTCGGRTTEYMAEDGLVTRLVESSCRGTGLQLTGAAPGGWYWQHGDRNAAVAPLVCSEALGGPSAVVPGGVTTEATDDGTLIRHDTARLIGIVPHLAGNDCDEYVTPYWQGDGGVVVRPAEGRETVRVRVQCGRTYSTMTPSAGEDGMIAELVRKSYCTDDEGNPKQGRLTVTGAAPGGWYWIRGEANAAVSPLMCADLLGGPEAVDPGGVVARSTEDGTYFEDDTSNLIGIVPHLAPNVDDN